MGDVEAIGGIIEDTIYTVEELYNNKEITKEKFNTCLIILNYINEECKKQDIKLNIDNKYLDIIYSYIPTLKILYSKKIGK